MDRLIHDARSRVQAFLDELERLKEAEFPYEQARDAVDQLVALFAAKLALLNTLDSKTHPAVVRQQCGLTLNSLFVLMPLAGFLLRSTNVRNAFELYRPLLRLGRDLLEPTIPRDQRRTRLVLSSEWDYSPLSYSELPDLPGFVLIGLPAPESSNPLLVPLAGHELGHSHWRQERISHRFEPALKKHILDIIQRRWTDYRAAFPLITISSAAELQTNLFAVESWQAAHRWSVSQAEETYCDLIGLQLFGTSYLQAYEYLLAPKSGTRPPHYPDQRRRVRHLLDAATALGIESPAGYDTFFDDDRIPASYLSTSDAFRLSIADEACDKVVTDLLAEAQNALAKATLRNAANPSDAEVQRIVGRLRRVVPAEHCSSLADIINAAWILVQDADLWKDSAELHGKRQQVLRELVLKNIEILEIEAIQLQPLPTTPPPP